VILSRCAIFRPATAELGLINALANQAEGHPKELFVVH
jgi:hypothetical protein